MRMRAGSELLRENLHGGLRVKDWNEGVDSNWPGVCNLPSSGLRRLNGPSAAGKPLACRTNRNRAALELVSILACCDLYLFIRRFIPEV